VKLHSFSKLKRFPWLTCDHCGLVRLKNKASQKAERQECVPPVVVFGMRVYDPDDTKNVSAYREALKRFKDS